MVCLCATFALPSAIDKCSRRTAIDSVDRLMFVEWANSEQEKILINVMNINTQ